jgi:hypothetical protein
MLSVSKTAPVLLGKSKVIWKRTGGYRAVAYFKKVA